MVHDRKSALPLRVVVAVLLLGAMDDDDATERMGGAAAAARPAEEEEGAAEGQGEGAEREGEVEGGPPLRQGREAAALAKAWYDTAGPLAGDLVLGPVTAAHMNYADGWDAEWSLRYTVETHAGCALPQEALAPLLREKFFVRFFYEYDEGKWSCYGLDENKASADADSGIDLDIKLWAKLVLRCAKALKRSASNLPAYVAEPSIQLQLGALGADAMRKILSLGSKDGELNEEDKDYVINTLEGAMRCPTLEGKNGAKAALNAVKWLAGGGQVAGGRHPSAGSVATDGKRSYKKRAVEADGNASPAKRRRSSGEIRRVFREDGVESTMLRREPSDTSDDSVWLENEATVSNGDLVQLVEKPAAPRVEVQASDDESGGGFVLIRTDRGDEGYVRSAYLLPLECRVKRGSAASKVNYNEQVLVKTRQDTWAEQVQKMKKPGASRFEVEEIVDKRMNNNPTGGRKKGVEYLVRWKGYEPEDDTWEPVQSLASVLGKVRAFEKKLERDENERVWIAQVAANHEGRKQNGARGTSKIGMDSSEAEEMAAPTARACTRCGKPGHNSRTCPVVLRPQPPTGPPPVDEAGIRQRGIVMRAVVGAERDQLLAKGQDAKGPGSKHPAAVEALCPKGGQRDDCTATEQADCVQQNPLAGILWVTAGTVKAIRDPDLDEHDDCNDNPQISQSEGLAGWRANSNGARFKSAGYSSGRSARERLKAFPSQESSSFGYTCGATKRYAGRARDKNSADSTRTPRTQLKCSVCGQGPSRWHPKTCPGTFIDALKYDTARAIGPEAARAASERTAKNRAAARWSTASGSQRGSGHSTAQGELPQQKGCAKCGQPLGPPHETTWARHGPKVGLHYHKRCRELPWPDPAQVALYTGIPEASPVRRQVKARVSKCNVCGQGPSRWHAANCNGKFVTQMREGHEAEASSSSRR